MKTKSKQNSDKVQLYGQEIPLLGVYQKEMKLYINQMFIAVLFFCNKNI